jgi:hypothetical protein
MSTEIAMRGRLGTYAVVADRNWPHVKLQKIRCRAAVPVLIASIARSHAAIAEPESQSCEPDSE